MREWVDPLNISGPVLTLLASMDMASRIVKSANAHHLNVRNFDRAGRLLEYAASHRPAIMIIDWDKREAEGFALLKKLRMTADLKEVAVVGFVSSHKMMLRDEAEKAGCLRVYFKTEFVKSLPDLWMRFAK